MCEAYKIGHGRFPFFPHLNVNTSERMTTFRKLQLKKSAVRCVLTLIALVIATTASGESRQSAGPFAWGAEAGGSIDLTSNDMSTLNIDAYFGYRGSIFEIAGAGAGIHVMVSNSCRAFPVYGMVRTSFSTTPRLCFLDLRAGAVFNNCDGMSTKGSRTRFYAAPSLGVHLARGRSFASYILLGMEYNGLQIQETEGENYNDHSGLFMATVKIGITF